MLTEKIISVAHYLDQVVLWVLIILSILSVGMILERFVSLRKAAENSQKIRARIKMALQANSVDDFEQIARDTESLEGRAASYALRHMKDSGSKGLEEVFNTYALTERPDLERFLSFLATIGSNAPYIGLFGTVLGIMKAFNDLAQSTDAGQQTVMAGIALALIATAAGLFVAIPAVISYNYFNKRVKSIFQSLEAVKELGLAYAKKKGI